MKNSLWAGLILSILVSGCQNPLPLLNTEAKSATLIVTTGAPQVAGGVAPRTILPDTMAPASYKLTGTGPSAATLGPLTSTTGSFSVPGLALGSWTITVEGLASDGDTVIVSGSTTLNLTASVVSAAVTLTPTTGNGTLVINLDWTASGRTVSTVTATLTRKGPGANPGPQSMTVNGKTATITLTGVSAESHLLTLVAKDGSGNVIANNKMETVLIYRGQTSTWNAVLAGSEFKSSAKDITQFNFLAANNSGASVSSDVNTTVSTTSFTVTLPAGASRASLAPTITLSPGATVSPTSGTTRDFTGSVNYTVSAADGTTKDYTVTVNVAPTLGLTAFSIGSTSGVITGTNIALTIPFSEDKTSRVATFTASSGATVKVDGNTQTSGTTTNNFTNTVNYVVSDAFGSTAKTYSVTVSYPTQLISLTIGNSLRTYRLESDGKTTAGSTATLTGTPSHPVVFDPTGAFAFALGSSGATKTFDRFTIDRSGPTLGTQNNGNFTNDARPPQFSKDGRFLYIVTPDEAASGYNYLDYYALDRSNGNMGSNLRTGTSFQLNNYMSDFRLFTKSDYAISTRSNVNTLALWQVNSDGSFSVYGAFTPASGFDDSTPDKKIEAVYLDQAESRIFAITGSGKVHSWAWAMGGGGMTASNPQSLTVTNPASALAFTGPSSAYPNKFAIHPSGKFAYILVPASNRILRINIATDGTLTQEALSAITTRSGNNNPVSMVFNKAGTLAFVSNPNTEWCEVYNVNTVTGALNWSYTSTFGTNIVMNRSGDYLVGISLAAGNYYLSVRPTTSLGQQTNAEVNLGSTKPSTLSVFEVYP